MNEREFKKLAEEYSDASEILLQNGRYVAAHYLAGISAECLLKSKIAAKTKAGDFPPKNSNEHHCHDITKLLKLAGLNEKADKEFTSKSAMGANIQTVRLWNVESRYNIGVERETAASMVVAVSDKSEGFNSWLAIK